MTGGYWKSRSDRSKTRDEDAKAAALARFHRDTVQAEHPNPDPEELIPMFEHDRTHSGKRVASRLPIMNMLTQTFADFSARTGSEVKVRQILASIS